MASTQRVLPSFQSSRTRVACMTAVVGAAWCGAAVGSPAMKSTTSKLAKMEQQLAALQTQVQKMKKSEEATAGKAWLNQRRSADIQAVVNHVMRDAKSRQQYLSNNLQAGYDNGFFISSPDKAFELVANGYLQFRYTFAQDRVQNAGIYGSHVPRSGNVNGFGFRRARLIFSGHAFTPNLTYSISGDFGGTFSNHANFQILDTFMAYKVNNLINVRAGSFLTPFTYVEYVSSGLELPDFAIDENPFDPVRSLGMSLFGNIIPNKLSYEVNVNDGANSNTLGRASDLGGAIDNRLAFYGRMQFAGSGKIADFNDEPDLENHQHLVWMIGGAGGFESQNSTASAFPAPQSSLTIFGLANPSGPGYAAPFAANGSVYRATLDGHLKYRGFALSAAAYFQDYNDSLTGNTGTDAFRSTFHRSSIYQLGYNVDAGYFIVPHKWEVVGRFAQLKTQGSNLTATQYELGLNYYMFGENAKIQGAVSYLPSGAPYTSAGVDSAINTQDIIGQLQFQMKF